MLLSLSGVITFENFHNDCFFQMFRCAGSWVTLSAFPPAEFVQSDLLKSTFSTLVSLISVITRVFVNIYNRKRTGFQRQANL